MTEVLLRCDKCGTPFAAIQNGAIKIEARHHGEKHTNVVAIVELLAHICQPGELAELLRMVLELHQKNSFGVQRSGIEDS